jgi:signal transduction histidine kinase
MASDSAGNKESPSIQSGLPRRFLPPLALAPVLVVVLLAALALVPILIQVKIRKLRTELTTIADPARAMVTELQLRLAMEALGARGFMLTGQQSYITIYREQQRARSDAYTTLLPLAERLGSPVDAETRELGEIFTSADSLLAPVISGQLSVEMYMEELPLREAAFTRAASTVALIDRGISEWAEARRGAIQSSERAGLLLTSVLVLLALTATGGVLQLIKEHKTVADQRERLLESERAARMAIEVARDEAERKREQLERMTESRAGLMRGFSHDVKNPLGAADGYLELLEDEIMGPVSEKQRESLARARRSLAAALRLIGDLIELARAESIQVEREEVDLRELIEELLEEYGGRAETKGLALSAEFSAEVETVNTDRTRLRQILMNLFSNAIKYSSAGRVTASVRVRDLERQGRRGPWVRIDVTDTGPGIAEDQERHLFREYYRADSAVGTEGTGIGLPISRRLARALGGDLTVNSTLGKGSTFTVWLPAD